MSDLKVSVAALAALDAAMQAKFAARIDDGRVSDRVAALLEARASELSHAIDLVRGLAIEYEMAEGVAHV